MSDRRSLACDSADTYPEKFALLHRGISAEHLAESSKNAEAAGLLVNGTHVRCLTPAPELSEMSVSSCRGHSGGGHPLVRVPRLRSPMVLRAAGTNGRSDVQIAGAWGS